MENAKWKGQPLIATEIAKDYFFEKKVRIASGHHELRCPDPECEAPALRYCHGEKRGAFFAHLNNENCDYAHFDQSNTQVMRTLKAMLYEHFVSLGYCVYFEMKLLPHHYSHLVIAMEDGTLMAIELGTKHLSANQLEGLAKAYKENGIVVRWLVIDHTDGLVAEDQTYFLKRYLYNETTQKELLVVNRTGTQVAQYRIDPYTYCYHGKNMAVEGYPTIYKEEGPLSALGIEAEALTLIDFKAHFTAWQRQKQEAFDKQLRVLEQREEMRQDQFFQAQARQLARKRYIEALKQGKKG